MPAPVPTPKIPDRPVRAGERLDHVDALRGAALLGILLVNLLAFGGPSFLHVRPLSFWEGADRWAEWGVLVSSEGAFYTIFSVLFGWGFGRWMRERGAASAGRFARRLGWLLVIGAVHLFGIWRGDILVNYALVGFLLLPFAARSARSLALWGAGAWAAGALLFAAISGEWPAGGGERWVALYGSGAAEAIVRTRIEQGFGSLATAVIYAPLLLGFFLTGAALAKGRAFERALRAGAGRRWWWRALALSAPAALVVKGIYAARLLGDEPLARFTLATSLGGPLQGAAYLAALTLLFTAPGAPRWSRWLERQLAAAGRTALTVYLSQSVVMTLIFYSYGLGLYGRLGPAWGVPLVLLVFALQVAAARWWLARFRFGPVEWLWRSLTYGRAQPWRLERGGGA